MYHHEARTKPRKHPRWRPPCLTNHHREIRVVLLDDRVVGLNKLPGIAGLHVSRTGMRVIHVYVSNGADRVPADAAPVCEHRIRISRMAGDSARAKDMAVSSLLGRRNTPIELS